MGTAAALFLWLSFSSRKCCVISTGPVCCHFHIFSPICLETDFFLVLFYSSHSFLTIQISHTPLLSIFYLRVYCIEVSRETGEPDSQPLCLSGFLCRSPQQIALRYTESSRREKARVRGLHNFCLKMSKTVQDSVGSAQVTFCVFSAHIQGPSTGQSGLSEGFLRHLF